MSNLTLDRNQLHHSHVSYTAQNNDSYYLDVKQRMVFSLRKGQHNFISLPLLGSFKMSWIQTSLSIAISSFVRLEVFEPFCILLFIKVFKRNCISHFPCRRIKLINFRPHLTLVFNNINFYFIWLWT